MRGATPEIIEGWLSIEDCTIARVEPHATNIAEYLEQHPDATVIDCSGKLVMPGLINAHTHASMTLQRSLADDKELLEWLHNHVWPFEARQNYDDIAIGAKLGIAEMLLSGTTTFADMYWEESNVARVVEQMGIRAVLGESTADGYHDKFKENMPRLIEIAKNSSLITAAVAPHAPYSCDTRTLRRAVKFAYQNDLICMTHLLESPQEREITMNNHNADPFDHMMDSGVITSSTILAHCVQLTDEEIDKIAEVGASVCYNPQSNMKLASGIAPIVKMMERGINVAIGTDGPCSNNDIDMWDEMRSATMLQKVATMNPEVMPAYTVLQMATVNGAKALKMEGKIGVINPGALADIIVIDLDKPHLTPLHDIVSCLVYAMKGSDVDMVFVNGKQLVERGRLIHADIKDIQNNAIKSANRIVKLNRVILECAQDLHEEKLNKRAAESQS